MVIAQKKIKEFRVYLKPHAVLVVYRDKSVQRFDNFHHFGRPPTGQLRLFYGDLTKKRELDFNYIFGTARKYSLRPGGSTSYPVVNGRVRIW